MAECKNCGGKGVVWDVVGLINTPNGLEEIYDEVACEKCEGTGIENKNEQEEIE